MDKLDAFIIPVTPFQQNCTLLFEKSSKKGVLIDPGGDLPYILNVIKTGGIEVENIWLTHGHVDHAGAAMSAKNALGVDLIGSHQNDKMLLDHLVDVAKYYNFSDPVLNCIPDRWLNDGDFVLCANHPFKVLHCPGHAPGHVVYFSQENHLAIVGDVLFRGSIGRTDLPGSNYDSLMCSLREKVLPLGDDINFLCGHGPSGCIGIERHDNPFLRNL